MMRRWAVLAGVLLASTALAGMELRQDVTTTLSSQDGPVEWAGTGIGSTTVSTSKTQASTTVDALLVGSAANVIDLDRTGSDWDVRLEWVSRSGFGSSDSATVFLSDGGPPVAQIVLLGTGVPQTTGAVLGLLPTTTSLDVLVVATKVSGDDNVIAMQAVLSPPGGGLELRYDYAVTIS